MKPQENLTMPLMIAFKPKSGKMSKEKDKRDPLGLDESASHEGGDQELDDLFGTSDSAAEESMKDSAEEMSEEDMARASASDAAEEGAVSLKDATLEQLKAALKKKEMEFKSGQEPVPVTGGN
jgi:hypothetical protein